MITLKNSRHIFSQQSSFEYYNSDGKHNCYVNITYTLFVCELIWTKHEK